MSQRPSEDLFESSTMTFGEHLEELRVALTRSLIGLAIGFLFGLLIANQVVRWIESPIGEALSVHYSETAKLKLKTPYFQYIPLKGSNTKRLEIEVVKIQGGSPSCIAEIRID